MVGRAAPLVLLGVVTAGCQCGFDATKLDELSCTRDTECRLDRDCVDGICQQRRCSEAPECGTDVQFGCEEGFCKVRSCGDAGACGDSFECIDGLCRRPSIDAGVDASVDAAVPCTEAAECGDDRDCTDDDCLDGFCAHSIRPGTCLVEAACRTPGEANPANGCEVCNPSGDADGWTIDDTRIPTDDIDCTDDLCQGGHPVHVPHDELCPGTACAPCAGGCVEPPALEVDCPEVPSAVGGAPAVCTVATSEGPAAATACVTCTTIVGMTSLIRDGFAGCPSLEQIGWQGTPGRVTCPAPDRLDPDPVVAEDQLAIEDGRAVLERWLDTTGFDAVRLCFDYALGDRMWVGGNGLRVEINTSGAWTSVWTSAEPPGGDDAWSNVCLDLVALDPLSAGHPSLGIRFRPVDAAALPVAIYLDNIAADAWTARTLDWPGPAVSTDFEGCELGEWAHSGGWLWCPTPDANWHDRDAPGVQEGSWTLTADLDVSDRCDGLRLGYSIAGHGVDSDDSFQAAIDPGGSRRVVWRSRQIPTSDRVLVPFEVSLSHVEPAVRLLRDLRVELTATALDSGDEMVVDDVWLDGARCLPADDLVRAEPVAEQETGRWTVAVSGEARATAYLQCVWDGRAGTRVFDAVQFCADAECAPGTVESGECGECGTRTRLCDTNCRFRAWSACDDLPCR